MISFSSILTDRTKNSRLAVSGLGFFSLSFLSFALGIFSGLFWIKPHNVLFFFYYKELAAG